MMTTSLEKTQLLELYRGMVLIRRCEEQLARSHQKGLIHGACHTYVGQEAIAAGVTCSSAARRRGLQHASRARARAGEGGLAAAAVRRALRPRDRLLAGARGLDAPVRARGRADGHQRHRRAVHPPGRRGRLQLQAAETDQVAVAFFGDGAVNNGAFHEGLNMAGIWKLPVLFVCENNQFATEVPFAYASASSSVAARGDSLRHAGLEVDGNDVLAVLRGGRGGGSSGPAAGGGPTLLECRTYRTRPHAEGMGDYTYRTREDVEAWKRAVPDRLPPRLRCWTPACVERDRARGHRGRGRRQSSTMPSSSPKPRPWPDPATATRFVFA